MTQTEFKFVQPSRKGKTIQEKFEIFHEDNPFVYVELVKLARLAKSKGKKKCGMQLLGEIFRWNRLMQTSDVNSEFKINNDYFSRYSRMIEEKESDLKEFFTKREIKTA